ncbi:MAG: hypothetical protein KJZ80_09575 [Hyphomicrobiaceae bacterium]|nr:hypothetical protein [Hyphomicrobiaceae bacterium]
MHSKVCTAAPAWLRVLARQGSFLKLTPDGAEAFSPRNRFAEAVATVDRKRLAAAVEAGLLRDIGQNRLGPTKRGIAVLRAAQCEAAAAGAGSPRAAPPTQTPAINDNESPLAWLRRRRDKDGRPLISEEEFEAGERLRADFWFAGMTPKVTSSWNATSSSRRERRAAPGAGIEMQDRIVAARERVRIALQAVGPELSGILIDVCCHLQGLEDAERAAGWPQRSGKVVLQLALARLARHYGLVRAGDEPSGRQRPRHWGAPDYRPAIDG